MTTQQPKDSPKKKRLLKIFYLQGRGLRGAQKIGSWLWLERHGLNPPSQLEILSHAIGHMHEELKNPNVDWKRMGKDFPSFKVDPPSTPKVVVQMSTKSFGKLMTIKGILLTGLGEMLEKRRKSITANEVVNFCLQERAREISFLAAIA